MFTKSSSSPAPPQYFNAVNTGTTTVLAATYALSQSGTTTVAVEACSGPWNESTHACSGTYTLLVMTASGATAGSARSTVVPAAPGASLRLRVRPTQTSKNARDTYTISTSVDRTAVRAATTTTELTAARQRPAPAVRSHRSRHSPCCL